MREKGRRFAVIARLPSLQLLNKSQISPTERESAERWAIRHYRDKKDKLHTYQQLVDIHGLLQPLAEINLSPLQHQATMQFHIDHEDWKKTEIHSVDLHWTIGQLKQWLSQKHNVPQAKIRLFHEDKDDMGMTVKVIGHRRTLLAFKMKDGDGIHVQLL